MGHAVGRAKVEKDGGIEVGRVKVEKDGGIEGGKRGETKQKPSREILVLRNSGQEGKPKKEEDWRVRQRRENQRECKG